ncbi:MAG: hypothetical protein A2538_00850 [Candidatus Magasanikbacteria bacterium RIFOXYD2_FULL_41_14]|uniref:Uncharacterized protein n=1 Tax=Candidatus Magasanikbacteria bacterium RIFOXYD2_FULL_41_14 TaxID=1798709 RepID=A0A1F6PE62_9BACT|nr:MAG: hypothetical protein A2538_00850 [Candidatus Magasanikbacteria bacterium RIFOXYD2_FULL_41_14]
MRLNGDEELGWSVLGQPNTEKPTRELLNQVVSGLVADTTGDSGVAPAAQFIAAHKELWGEFEKAVRADMVGKERAAQALLAAVLKNVMKSPEN